MPFFTSLDFVVFGAVAHFVIGAGVAHLDYQNCYNRKERIVKRLEEEAEALGKAFEFARDPLRRDSKVIRNLLRTARYGYIKEYFPENNCVGPSLSGLERLLQQGGNTGVGLENKIRDYYPRFRYALRRTCRSLNGRSQNGSKHKLSHLMYELYHAIFADVWELALPYMIAEASTTRTIIKLPLDEMKGYEAEAKRLFEISYNNPKNWETCFRGCISINGVPKFRDLFLQIKLTFVLPIMKMIQLPQLNADQINTFKLRVKDDCYVGESEDDLFFDVLEQKKIIIQNFGDYDYYQKINDVTLEFVEIHYSFIILVTVTFYIAYLIGKQKPDFHDIFRVLRQLYLYLFLFSSSVLFAIFLSWMMWFCLLGIFLRSLLALDAVTREKNRSDLNSSKTWSIFFEIHLLGPLEIAGDRGFKNLICCFGMIQHFLRQSIIIPLLDFFDPLFHRESNELTAPDTEEGNPLLPTPLPFNYGSVSENERRSEFISEENHVYSCNVSENC